MSAEFDVDAYLNSLDDAGLVASFNEAKNDLEAAANDKPDSDWHSECFAAVLIYAGELNKRGLKASTVH